MSVFFVDMQTAVGGSPPPENRINWLHLLRINTKKKEQYEEEAKKKIINKHRTARRSVRSVLIYSADVPVRQSAGFVFIFGMRGKLDDTSCWPRVFRSFHSRSRKRKNQNLMQMGNSCRRGRPIELKKYRNEMFFR